MAKTEQELNAIAKHAHDIFRRDLPLMPSRREGWLHYLDQNCSKEGVDSEWSRVHAKVQDMIEPGSAYGEKK